MDTWKFIHDKQSASVNVLLLYVLQSKGSSPGRQGFKMAVAADNELCGSIGGGIMEHKFIEMAKLALSTKPLPAEVFLQQHDKGAGKNKSGMICSGEQIVFLYQVQNKDMLHIEALLQSAHQNRNGTLILSNEGIFFSDEVPTQNFFFEQADEQQFVLKEKTGYKNELHIIGGGHCSLALSRLMSRMDFFIKVYEERHDLNTVLQNNYAKEIIYVSSYSELEYIIPEGNNVFIVIMTFGYRTDDKTLRALLNRKVKYIGVLGSSKKMEKLFSTYHAEGLDKELLKKVKTPIGIPIKSQTPEEIAVSIAAEIILEKNTDQ